MIGKRILSMSLILAVLLSCFSIPVMADRDDRDHDRRDSSRYKNNDHRDNGRYYRTNGREYDRRYDHNRYYPPRGTYITTIPRNYRAVPYQGTSWYFSAGIWYRPSGSRYVVVLPPVGITIPILPPYYTTIWVGGMPYYYSGGVYYNWVPERRVYVVAAPPPESDVITAPAVPNQLFVYPQKGQSEEQQAADRFQCHSWANEQTGFDPTRPIGNVDPTAYNTKRTDYQRAMKACLEARGYSVQ